MDPEELRRMVAAGTESIAAWEAFVQLRELSYRIMTDADFSASPEQLRLYREIVRHDPDFTEAHLLIARTAYEWMSPLNMQTPPAGLRETAGPPNQSNPNKASLENVHGASAIRVARGCII